MLYKAEGIVIRCMDYGEGHLIITLYTSQYGKVSVMVRGARKTKSRFSAITQLFTYGEYVFYKSSSMGTLNQGEVIESHHLLRENLHMTAYSAYLAEMVDRVSPAVDDSSMIAFAQLLGGLNAIEKGKDPQIVTHLFEMKILEISGYMPSLFDCVFCGVPSNHEILSTRLGGILCESCFSKDAAALTISGGVLRLLRLFQRTDLHRLGNIEVKDATKLQLRQAIRGLMDRHIGIDWRARGFLDQMDKYGL